MTKVHFIEASTKQQNGEFTSFVQKAYRNIEDAQAELKSIEESNNADEPHLENWRVKRSLHNQNRIELQYADERGNWRTKASYAILSVELI